MVEQTRSVAGIPPHCAAPARRPVDSAGTGPHCTRVKAKPRKVEEPAGTYATAPKLPEASPMAQPGLRLARIQDVRKTNARLMQVHRKILEKLAQ
jgi:hypothetical protein